MPELKCSMGDQRCDICGDRATVHLTDCLGGKPVLRRLCETCYASAGEDAELGAPWFSKTALLEPCKTAHAAVVSYVSSVGREYVEALARVVEVGRTVAAEHFGFDMPETVVVRVLQSRKLALHTDGHDTIFLCIRSEADLRKPEESGVFQLYGLCHEIGHIAMGRLIPEPGWMTVCAREGWAHYFGSRLVDEVYEREGGELWPDRYDYLADGTARLNKDVLSGQESHFRCASLWMELVEIIGDGGLAPVFKAWGKGPVVRAEPMAILQGALLSTSHGCRLTAWLQMAGPLFVRKPATVG